MQDVQHALVTKLAADSTLMGLLAHGTASIYGERDLTGDRSDFPWIEISSQGGRPHMGPDVSAETYTFRVADQQYGYERINQIRRRIKQLLHDQPLTMIDTTSRYEMGCYWTWDTPQYYDIEFQCQFGGDRFQVIIGDSDFIH
jgi:hypothetical protein